MLAYPQLWEKPQKWNNDVINANNRLLGLPETKLVESGTLH